MFIASSFFSRYAKEVVNNFRFIVLYAIGVSTSALTLCGIILLVVSVTCNILCDKFTK